MKIELNPLEARVIGCLIEKEITTPEQYQAHALAWLAAATDIELLHAQWNRERSKRAELGIVEDLLIALNTAKGDRLKTLKAAA